MISTSITLKEPSGVIRKNIPIRLGIPFPKGALRDTNNISLSDNKNQPINYNLSTTASWPDNSIKWGILDFQTSLDPNETKLLTLSLTSKTSSLEISNSIQINNSEKRFTINTGEAEFTLNIHRSSLFEKVTVNHRVFNSGNDQILLTCKDNINYKPVITDIIKDKTNSYLRAGFTLKGHFESDEKHTFADFESTLCFHAGKSTVIWDFTLHNTKSAKHPGGIWDLGDPGSVFFKSLAINFNLPSNSTCTWKAGQGQPWIDCNDQQLSIYQESSGGKNWNGNIHKNFQGIIPHKHKGYRIEAPNSVLETGDRISPTFHIDSESNCLTAHIKNFWQNFPKAFELSDKQLSIQLFPQKYPDNFELQGGEKKTHTIYLNFGKDKNALEWAESPVIPELNYSWFVQSKAMPYLANNHKIHDLDKLILEGLTSQNNYFQKRETIDEYGWRNFGDIYADHETVGHEGEQALVSHYNNQYDSLYGFARQYMLSGDQRWFVLMDQLAQHISDIDIYNTDNDRAEYNGGLFWHTDHYLDAFTCSHRTYSKWHHSDEELGGGPGTEHCYTTGLLYHYFLTGSESSKQALLVLRKWIENLHEGSGTLLERILAIKNTDIPNIRALLSGSRVSNFKYPLTRGTGNYLSTVIDAYILTSERKHIDLAERIIMQTTHPFEDISERHLENIEVTWSYTVFLQALVKYLNLKETLEELDTTFFYAKDSLLNFADWMQQHEYPFLDKPEILEYPNHTWVAQEIRKVNLFFAAYQYCDKIETRMVYLNKARYFYDYVIRELEHEETKSFSRILAILMQNHGPHALLAEEQGVKSFNPKLVEPYKGLQKLSVYSILGKMMIDLAKKIARLSISREMKWLQQRSDFFARLTKQKK